MTSLLNGSNAAVLLILAFLMFSSLGVLAPIVVRLGAVRKVHKDSFVIGGWLRAYADNSRKDLTEVEASRDAFAYSPTPVFKSKRIGTLSVDVGAEPHRQEGKDAADFLALERLGLTASKVEGARSSSMGLSLALLVGSAFLVGLLLSRVSSRHSDRREN